MRISWGTVKELRRDEHTYSQHIQGKRGEMF